MNINAATAKNADLNRYAQKWVGQTFFGTLLKQVRESPFKNEMMSGGRGGQAFGSMLDMQLAERMAKGSGSKLVNAIVRKIESNNGVTSQRKPSGISTQPFMGDIK